MHRVELKEESSEEQPATKTEVPNAPCGVESYIDIPLLTIQAQFLMHRVELKANQARTSLLKHSQVPNAPCGVERRI